MNSCIGIGSLAIVIMVVFDCISKMYIRMNSSMNTFISVLLYNVEQIRKLFNIIFADRKMYVLLHLLFFSKIIMQSKIYHMDNNVNALNIPHQVVIFCVRKYFYSGLQQFHMHYTPSIRCHNFVCVESKQNNILKIIDG